MSYKTVLSVTGIHQSDDDLRAAAELCASAGAHLSALVVALSASPPIGEYAAAVSVDWLDERSREIAKLDERAEDAKALLAQTGISFDVDTIYTEIAWSDEEIGERASYADISLLGPGLKLDPELRVRAIDGCLFKSARPVLIVPKRGKPTLSPRTIILAWDSRLEAARAAREAIDMMKNAEVHVTLVDPRASSARNGEEPGADIAAYLARHGIEVTVDRLASGGRPVDDVLNQHALDVSADLMVMGGYSHSRLRERIFGGVTRAMLESANIPVLMIH
ncbi:universal stress protein [Pararhizobium sp. A13]|uniref:universal stress protein n=1 Tax=Pararhizobium sp. A13 TaxID=3133975 RepID=UPI00311B1C06